MSRNIIVHTYKYLNVCEYICCSIDNTNNSIGDI